MELIIFLTLTGLGSLFVLAAALSKDRVNLIPAAALFLITSLFLLSGTGLEYQDGLNYEYDDVNGSQEVVAETPEYSTVEFPVEEVEFNSILGLTLLMISLYFFIISGARTRFYSLMRR